MTTDAAPLSAPPPPPPPPSARLQRIAAAFQALYGIPPAFLARAPGRVNLIGSLLHGRPPTADCPLGRTV